MTLAMESMLYSSAGCVCVGTKSGLYISGQIFCKLHKANQIKSYVPLPNLEY